MSKYVDKVTYRLNLADKLDGLSSQEKRDTLEEVGTYLVEKILESCDRARSPVKGGKWKQSLSAKYLERKKSESGSAYPNMELTGAMLDALEYKITGNTVEVGIFDTDEAQKADNHNKFSGASQRTNVPQRQFIPNNKNGETFKRDITQEINQIISEAVENYGKN